jgi:hypothetical protein
MAIPLFTPFFHPFICKNSSIQEKLYKYIDLYLFTQRREGGGEGGEPVRRLEEQYFTREVENTNMTDCISSLCREGFLFLPCNN